MKKYFSMNNIEIGTKMQVVKTGELVILSKIFHYPTSFQVKKSNGELKVYKTHEVQMMDEQ